MIFFRFKILYIFLTSLLISGVEIKSMLITSLSQDTDLDSIIVFDIGRPSLNADSEWLSFEKNFNYKTHKYEVYFSNQYLNNGSEHIKFHKSGGKRKKKHYAENIMWPRYIDDPDAPAFYFFHNKTKINAWSFEVASISDNAFEIFKIYPTSGQRALGDLKMDFMSIPDSWGDELYYLIATSNSSGAPRKFIISSPDAYVNYNPDNFAIFDSNDSEYNRNLKSSINDNDLLRNPSEIQTKDFNDLGVSQVAVNFKSQAKAQQYDIYYFCDINDENFYGDAGYQLFPRKDEYIEDGTYYPFCNQFEPQFNFNGSKVAFLNQRVNTNEKTRNSEPCAGDKDIDLWVFDLSQYFDRVCQEDYKLKADNSSFSDDYYQIDETIRNLFRFEQETNSKLSLARDYAWHPKRDVLFYISEKTNDRGEIYWPISYYNFENCSDDSFSSCEKGMLDTHTLDNRHISISQDGEHVLFSFSKVNNKTATADANDPNKINIPTVEDGKCYNCHMYNKWKVAVAKILIDDE